MPTMAGRASFLPLAVTLFLRQDYPCTELVIIGDEESPAVALLPAHERIRHFKLDRKLKLGMKRNYACELAKGDIIMHWDDDDWYAPDWISSQVRLLNVSGADICGLSRLFFFSPAQWQCWKYIYPPTNLPWVAGATLAYRKSCWRRHPFRGIQVGEDNEFVWHSGGKVVAHTNDQPGFVSILHPGNTSPKYTGNPMWYSCPVDEVTRLMGADTIYYKKGHIEPNPGPDC